MSSVHNSWREVRQGLKQVKINAAFKTLYPARRRVYGPMGHMGQRDSLSSLANSWH
jgi:hypothetical protein